MERLSRQLEVLAQAGRLRGVDAGLLPPDQTGGQ
jgi:hypothetical protein